ncbi:MAG: response regulator, partial [Bacteroidales bacterium]|nr:response regulator [Bacteroidales bacterium]
ATALLYIAVLLALLALTAGFGYLATKHLLLPIEKLNRYIASLTRNTSAGGRIDFRHTPVEIRPVYLEFHNLFNQLKAGEQQRDNALKHANDNHQRYRELTDLLPQSVFETDSYGNYTYVNKAWFKAFGYVQTDLDDGLNLIETLISGSQHDDILGMQKIQNSSFIARRKNGSKFPASVYTDNIMRHGQVAGKRGIIIDITDKVNYIRSLQQETSRAKTSDELKSSFLANMSHEIRTPMNSIIGFSNLLASEQIPDNQKKDFTQYIRTSSEILLNLVDDIIDIAKIEAGELKIVKKDCDLNALGNELLTTSEETRKRLGKAQLKLHFIPDDGSRNVLLKTDPFRLRQVLVNLINNALKFTENGSVNFGYRIKEDRLVEFFVKDTGPGLTREELDMIFERFKRARFSEEKNIAGTGLGLAISRNLVKLLGGEMWVDSVAGEGTTFLFTLPYLRTTVLAAEPDQRKSAESSYYNWQGKTLLIAEDDHNSFRFLRELLAGTQATIIHAANGKQAVDAVSSNPVDLVLMDILLPEMDGLEATRNIKMINPRLPVIAQTAYAMSGDMEKMKAAGCDDYISKPLDLKKLLNIIHRYLIPGNNNLTDKTPSYRHNPSGIISN